MMLIKFADRDALKKGLGFLLGRFSGRLLRSGELIVPEPALEALKENKITFTVIRRATYEDHLAALRGDAASAVQRRKARS